MTPQLFDRDGNQGIALVTGGTGGIGSAIVRHLIANNVQVAFTFQSSDPTDLIQELDGKAEAHQLNLQDPHACVELVDLLVKRYKTIHTFIHAAGPHVPMTHLSRVSPSLFAEQINADLLGFFNALHASLPSLRLSSGSIVAVTSAATSRYPKRDGLSSIPKSGIEAMVRALAVEEGRYGVRANCVGPGMLSDGMAARLMRSGDLNAAALRAAVDNIPLGRFGTAPDIAEAVAFLASTRAQFISGQKLDVDGGYGA